MATNVPSTFEWGNRNPNEFVSSLLTQSTVYNLFTMVDGVKSKYQMPTAEATISFHGDLCVFDPLATVTVGEKEMAVADYKWDFSDCKGSLDQTYRSLLLKKGLHNAETMDRSLGEWAFDRFSALVSEKILTESALQIVDKLENGVDAADVNTIAAVTLTKANILATMESMYEAAPEALLDAIEGDSTEIVRPVWMLGTKAYQLYRLATKDLNLAYNRDDQSRFPAPPFLDIQVVRYPKLEDGVIIMAQPTNFVLLTDDLNDPNQINQEYEWRTNSLDVGGQFKMGFDVIKAAEVVLMTPRTT